MFLVLLPFLSSGFVPTDSMPDGLGWFAENQPFTPIIETVRGLLLGHADRRQRRRSPSPGASRSRSSATSGRGGCTTAAGCARRAAGASSDRRVP